MRNKVTFGEESRKESGAAIRTDAEATSALKAQVITEDKG